VDGVFSGFQSGTGNWTLAAQHVTGVTTTTFVSGTLNTDAVWSATRTAAGVLLASTIQAFEGAVTENSGTSSIIPVFAFTYRLVG
jgi:hypothetical protein